MDVMKKHYSDFVLWLQECDVTGDDILDCATWLYLKIQAAIEKMDRRCLPEY